MKFRQEFRVQENKDTVWQFFEQPLSVAECIPGVEKAELLDADNVSVRATQKLGPMSATFEARVRITDRVDRERIEFSSTGKAVRGAAGNFRAQNAVTLTAVDGETDVVVEGEAALAGVLGTIGHTVINKQAAKVTAEFARNLEQAFSAPAASPAEPPKPAPKQSTVPAAPNTAKSPTVPTPPRSDPWTKAAAILSGTATIIGLIILWRLSV